MIDYGQIDRFLSPTSAIGEVVIRPAEPNPYQKHMKGLGFEIPDSHLRVPSIHSLRP